MRGADFVSLFCASAAIVVLAAGAPASAQSANRATVFIVHGIPGRDVGAGLDPALPVDVSVNGVCILHNVTFGTVGGPHVFPAGGHMVVARPALELQPVRGQPALVAAPGPSAEPAPERVKLGLTSAPLNRANIVLVNAAAANNAVTLPTRVLPDVL